MDDDVEPSWLKMKVEMPTLEQLNDTAAKLQRLGYRIGNFNWPSLIDSSRHFPNAAVASRLWLDVPIHQNLAESDILIMAEQLSDIAYDE